MPGGAPTFGLNFFLDAVFGSGTPATLHVGLTTVEPEFDDDGSSISEPSGGAYARVALTNNATNWPAAENGQQLNGVDIFFPEATASWGTVKYAVICDASTGGNVLAYAKLSIGRSVASGQAPWFAEGLLGFTLASSEV